MRFELPNTPNFEALSAQGMAGSDLPCPDEPTAVNLPGRCAFASLSSAMTACLGIPECQSITHYRNGEHGLMGREAAGTAALPRSRAAQRHRARRADPLPTRRNRRVLGAGVGATVARPDAAGQLCGALCGHAHQTGRQRPGAARRRGMLRCATASTRPVLCACSIPAHVPVQPNCCPPPPRLQVNAMLLAANGTVIEPTAADVAAAAASPGSAYLGCLVSSHVIMAGAVVGVQDGVPSAEACCRECRKRAPECMVWTYCEKPGGCRCALRETRALLPGRCSGGRG